MKLYITFFICFFSGQYLFGQAADKLRLTNLLKQAEFYIEAENFQQAEELCHEAKKLFKKIGKENDMTTIAGMHAVSHLYNKKKMHKEAINNESLLVEVFPKALPEDTLEYALYLSDLAFYQLCAKDLKKASQNTYKALSIVGDREDIKYAPLYIRASDIYGNAEFAKYDKALMYQKKVTDMFADKYGKDSQEYLNELKFVANYYEKLEDYQNASDIYLEVSKGIVNNSDSINWGNILLLLDRIICTSRKAGLENREKQAKEVAYGIELRKNEYHKANIPTSDFPSERDSVAYESLSAQLESLKDAKAKTDFLFAQPDSYAKAYCLYLKTFTNSLKNKSKESVEVGIETKRIFNELNIINVPYIQTLSNIAEAYNHLGNPAKAYEYALEAFELRGDYLSTDDHLYLGLVHDLAFYSSCLGNYIDAIKYGSMVVKERAFYKYTDSPFAYFSSFCNLASAYDNIGRPDINLYLLEQLVKEAEDLAPKVLEDPYSPALSNLARAYSSNGDNDKAIEIANRVKAIREELGDKELLSNIYNNLSSIYRQKGELKESLLYAEKVIKLREAVYMNNEMELYNAYDGIAMIYRAMMDATKAEQFERKAMEVAYNNIVANFMDLPSLDRDSYWQEYSNIFTTWYPNFYVESNVKDASELYNKTALFAKGILLNTETEMSKLILKSGDSASLDKYYNMLRNRSLLANISSSQTSISQVFIDSIRNENVRYERELIKECKAFGDYTKSMHISWKEVQSSLKATDIAIEFIAFPRTEEQGQEPKMIYAALTLKKDSKTPKYIYLCEESEIDSIQNIGLLSNALYDLIWKPLEKELKNTNNVFFSPTEKLYNINIEVLPMLISPEDNRNYYRLSSTREIVLNTPINDKSNSKIKLYGGLSYDMSTDDLVEINKVYKQEKTKREDFDTSRSSRESINRARFGYLGGTLDEVRTIEDIARTNNKNCEVLTGEYGTEESFRSVNGKKYEMLHFATHGFYWTEEEAEKKSSRTRLSFLQANNEQPRKQVEDKAMSRSGLIFSGANLALKGIELPEGVEDGIATALEISHLDLSGCDLVVLSACQTGLGEVSSEGVFGLQRGFKKAGVKSLLMSLWEIDDQATRMLMVEFYKNYLSGTSKLASLHQAQQYIMSQPGFESPEYWAGFILLDGIEN